MKFLRKPIPILGILTLLTLSFAAQGQGVLNRRTLGNLNVPQLQRGSITPLSSSFEQQLQTLKHEQQIQLAMLNGASFKELQSLLPESMLKDSLALKDYVKRNIFRDTLVFGSELFRFGKLDFAPSMQLANAPNYMVGVGDKLTLTLYGQQEAAYELEVLPNGTLVIPYAGVVPVSGLNLGAVEALIKQKFIKAGYTGLQSSATQLSIALTGVRSIRVSVVGGRFPGSYVVPSIATLLHVLYEAGGPAENGTYRHIELVRQGKVVETLDLYRFISTGDLSDNAVLQEGDVIRIPIYRTRINLMGEFKRPGLFEVLDDESIQEVMAYAGNFSEGAFKKQLIIFSTGEEELSVADIADTAFATTQPKSGDVVLALPLRNRYVNRISLTGGVVRPGYYGWETGLTFQGALVKAQGLDRQAFGSKGVLLRRPDQEAASYMEFDPTLDDFDLHPNDSVYVGMYADLQVYDSVSLKGNVLRPGNFVYHPGITAEQLLLMAGGVLATGDLSSIEIANPILDSRGYFTGKSEIIMHSPNFNGEGYTLRKGATVNVRQRPNIGSSNVVYFTGAVVNPGAYSLSQRGEKLDVLFSRVGALTEDALPQFGLIVRKDGTRLNRLGLYKLSETTVETDSMGYLQEEFIPIQRIAKDTIAVNFSNSQQLKRIGLEDGDTIYIPREMNFVMVRGSVKNPGGHAFTPGRSAKYYLQKSGGYRQGADGKDVLVEYANGQSAEIRYALGFIPVYPRVYSNTTITVLPRPEKKGGLNAGELAAYTSSLASISSITLGLIYLLRP
jgi:protein involved in polysaccharide export with SLBB domain